MNRYACAAPIVGFAILEILLIAFADRPVSDFMRDLDAGHHQLIDCFRAITDFAKSAWYLAASACGIGLCALLLRMRLFGWRERQRIARLGHHLVFFFASIALSGIVTDILKPVLGRARPVEAVRAHAYGFTPFTFQASWNGMPSGHATTAAAAASVLIVLAPRGRALWAAIALALAASRVIVNAHYLSDVLAGAAVGLLTTLAVSRLRDRQGMFPLIKGIFPIDTPPPPG